MTSPIELIREGILAADWAKVCQGFSLMTGVEIAQPTVAIAEANDVYRDILVGIRMYIDTNLTKVSVKKTPAPVTQQPQPSPAQTLVEPTWSEKAKPKEDKDLYEQFKTQPSGNVDGKKVCKLVPDAPGHQEPNRFQPEGTIDALVEESRTLSIKAKPQPRRPPPPKVKVVCGKCHDILEVDPIFAPKRLDASDEESTFTCDECFRHQR